MKGLSKVVIIVLVAVAVYFLVSPIGEPSFFGSDGDFRLSQGDRELALSPPCTDTDGGQDFYTAGSVTDSSGTYDDFCGDSTTVVEYYCDDNEDVGDSTLYCFNGCLGNECVKGEEPYCRILGAQGEGWYVFDPIDGEVLQMIASCSGDHAVCTTPGFSGELQ